MKLVRLMTAAAVMALSAWSANAAILVDGAPVGPDTSPYFVGSNKDNFQTYLVEVVFDSAVTVTGFSVYTPLQYANVGMAVSLQIAPGTAEDYPILADVVTYSSTLDSVTSTDGTNGIAHASFAPIALGAGSYWIGMSGHLVQLAWSSFPGDPDFLAPTNQVLIVDNTLSPHNHPGLRYLGFTIDGEGEPGRRADATDLLGHPPQGVPEPATWAMMIAGFGLVGVALRRRPALQRQA
jgi:hypothetical protein